MEKLPRLPGTYEDDQGRKFQVDDTQGCFALVTYMDVSGVVGVNLGSNATANQPWAWSLTPMQARKGPHGGVKQGNTNGPDFGTNFRKLCQALVRQHEQDEQRRRFDPKPYCRELHREVARLVKRG
ncbi:MAG: hypothetical protein OXG64_06440 [Chloroflexi bacterium]|nr:hypothetical protein [Chloroflexota bacterium]